MNIQPIMNTHRGLDAYGDGAFASNRVNRMHKGRDYQYAVGEAFRTPVAGVIRRIGLPYASEEYKLIELLTDKKEMIWRYFYVKPSVAVGDHVASGQIVGYVQNIQKKYGELMQNHVHVECIVDPAWLFQNLARETRGPTWV